MEKTKTYTTIKTAEDANEQIDRLVAEGANQIRRIVDMPDGEAKERAIVAHLERHGRDFGATAQELAAAAENAMGYGDLETARQLLDIADKAVEQAKISAARIPNRDVSLAYTNARAAVDAARAELEDMEQFELKEFTTFWCEYHGNSAGPYFESWCSEGVLLKDYLHCQMVEIQVTKTGRTLNQIYSERVAS